MINIYIQIWGWNLIMGKLFISWKETKFSKCEGLILQYCRLSKKSSLISLTTHIELTKSVLPYDKINFKSMSYYNNCKQHKCPQRQDSRFSLAGDTYMMKVHILPRMITEVICIS